MECIWNENNEKLSQLILKMWCFIVSWFVWKIKIVNRNGNLQNYGLIMLQSLLKIGVGGGVSCMSHKI